jgi:outer membrane protein assembly factor BamB
MILASLQVLALTLSPLPGDPPEWGGFRGNDGSGVTERGSVPGKLDRDSNLLWRQPVPAGYSSPVVAGRRVFLTAAEDGELVTMCLERDTGEVQWRSAVAYDGTKVGANSAAAPTPATDGERVFSFFHHTGLVAYDAAGDELWRNELGAPYNIPHGMSSSPVLAGDKLLLQVDQDGGSYLAALDKLTGEQVWRADRPGFTHGYATPAVYTPDEGPAQVIVPGAMQIVAYSVETGEKLWWVRGAAWQAKATPVFHGDLCIVNAHMVSTSEFGAPVITQSFEEALAERDADGDGAIGKDEWAHEMMQQAWFIFDLNEDLKLDADDYAYLLQAGRATGGLFCIRLGGEGDVTESHVVWRYEERRGLSDLISPVVVEETLFLLKGPGILTAMDVATGEVIKQGRVGESDQYYASPVAAGGRILTASQSGQVAVVDGVREWEVVSTANLGEQIWSSPAIAGELVFVRSQSALYCFHADGE